MTIISCQCGKQFKAQPHLWGKRVACPSCQQPLEISTPPPIPVSCLCGQSFRAKPELGGKTLACPKCGNSLQVPLPGAAQPSPTPDSFDIPQQPVAQPQQYQRPVAPAAKSSGDSSSMAIKFAIGIGGGAVALLLLFIVGSMLFAPSDDADLPGNTEPVAQLDDEESEASSASFSNDPPPIISPSESQGLPRTAAELEQFYSLPPGTEDTTELWTRGIGAFARQRFLDEAAAHPVLTDRRVAIPMPDQPWPELDQVQVILAKAQPALDRMHSAADKGGAARYPTRFADGFSMLLPEVQELRDASQILRVQAFIHAREGDNAAVARNIQTMLRASASLGDFPMEVPCLVRIVLLTDAVKTLGQLLPHAHFSASELDALKSGLLAQELDRGLHKALVGERAIGLQGFEAPEQTLRMYSQNVAPTPLSDDEIQRWVKTISINVDHDRQTFEQLMDQNLAVAKLPSTERLNNATVGRDFMDRMKSSSDTDRRKSPLCLLLVPRHDSLFEATAMGESIRDAGVVAIASEQFQLRENKPPKALSDLVPDFIANVPTDPYSGRPLNYSVDSSRYVVYSVGDNGQDDGGAVTNASDYGVEVLLTGN